MLGGYPPHSNRDVFRLLVGADGYTLAPAADLSAIAAQEPAALAAYWQSWEGLRSRTPETDVRHTFWSPGAMTDDYGRIHRALISKVR